MIKLFVGLGNPGPEYEATRHNAGFWWIDALARELKVSLSMSKGYHGLVGRTVVHGQTGLIYSNEAQFRHALQRLLTEPALRTALSAAAKH